MNSSKIRYRLSPNEEAGILQQERDRRRKLRIQQVREQERAFAKHIRDQVEMKKQQELKVLALQLKDNWMIAKEEEQQALKDLYQKTLDAVGGAHFSAETQPPYDKIREETKVENDKKAKERGQKAFQRQQEEDEKRLQEEFALVMARKTALEIERARAALIAKKPSHKSDLNDAEVTKQPTRVLHLDGFSTTHYTIPTEYAEKADPEEQGDAKQAAREEEKRMKEEMKEKKQELEERKTKASLRQRHAQEKEQLEKDLNHLLEELGQMEQADRRRRQLVVSNIPKQIFVPPHRRLEEKEENQKDLEQAFENMYMAKTDYAGDIELALEPALPQVEADLDLSSDTAEEHFKLPEKAEPKRFPQGLDEVKKMSPTGKRDTLRKLLLKVQSQKHDHKLRKKTEISQHIVDGLPQESSSPSEVTESVSSSGITPSSITTESTITKTSSSTQTSSNLSQHPLSSSETESRLPSSVSGSLETGPISDESSSNGKSTLMHPLEAANKFRKKEKDEEDMKMRNHERGGQGQKYEEFHPLQEQTTFPEKTFDNMREIQPLNSHLQDQNLIYQEEQKFGSDSGETQSLEEISESFDESKEGMRGRSITGGVTVPASKGYRNFEQDEMHCGGTAEFQPLEPSQMNSLSCEPRHNLAMGTPGVGRSHEDHNMVDVASERQDVISGRANGKKMHRPDEDLSRRHGGSLNKESVQQTDLRASASEAHSHPIEKVTSLSSGGHQGIHSSTRQRVVQDGMPTKFDELQSNQLIRDLSPSQLESIRRAYPNIYEAVTGKNRNEVDSDVDSYVPSVGDTAHHMATVGRMTGGDVRMDSEILGVNRKLSSSEMTSFGERDVAGSKVARPDVGSLEGDMKKSTLEVGTGDVDKGTATESEISEKSSDSLKDPSVEFRSSLHDYQKQLLKLQRTNELQLLEAQAQLQQRRQRLMDLYPQIQLPAYKPYIPGGNREVLRKDEEEGGSGKEDEEENEKRSGRMDSTVNDTTGRKMDHRSMPGIEETRTVPSHHTGGQGRELRTDMKCNYFEETFQNTNNIREMNSGFQGSHLGTAQGGITDSAFERSSWSTHMGERTQPFQDELRGSRMSDEGPVHLQSFSTSPLYSEGLPSASGYGSTNFQCPSPQMGARRLHEAQNEPGRQQMCPQESWGAPHVHQEEICQATESNISQEQIQDETLEAREMQSKGNSEHVRYSSFTKVESVPKKSPHGVWRPVKELRVSLPSVEMLEQSPLTTENASSLFSEQGSSFTKTPTTESHEPPGGRQPLDHDSKPEEGQQVLLTPRKLAQLDKASSFNVPVDQSSNHSEPKVNQLLFPQEALSPRKLITPRMLVGEREEARRTLDTHLHEETIINTSCEATADVLQYMDQTGEYPTDQEVPQYREENKMTSYQEIPTDEFVKRLESHFQKSESLKRDFHFQGMNQTSKSSPDLILPDNDARGLPQSQTMSALSIRSQSESSLDMGTFSKRGSVGRFYDQESLFSENDSVVLNREKETTQGSFGMGQVTTNFGQISTGFNENLTSYDQLQTSNDQIPKSFGQVHADKFLNDEEDFNASSNDGVTLPKDMPGSSHIIKHVNKTTKDHSNTNWEEPTDRGLLEALKNLMLAKARNKVSGAATRTTNYFTHLDLTNSGSKKTNPLKDENEGLKSSDASSRVLFEAESGTDEMRENGMVRSTEELKVPMVRHRIHHKPPIANQSKLLALEEMAPHELSTIIEVETPVFENLPTFPFPEKDIEKGIQRSQNGGHGSFDEGVTSSSDWGTPHHHTPGSSQGSGSNQSHEIYIHQPMMVSSVEELEGEEELTLMGEKSGRDDLMNKESSKGDLSITSQTSMKEPLMTSSVYSMSSQTGAIRRTASNDSNVSLLSVKISPHKENLDDMTLSEGPISTSSENSFIQQVPEQGNDASDPLEQGLTSNQLFPLSAEVLKMRSPRYEGRDQKLATSEDEAGFQYQRGMKKSPISNHGATSISGAGLDYKDSKGEGRSSVQSVIDVTIEPENGDLTLEEGPLQETLTEDREFAAQHQGGEVELPHPDPRMSFQVPSHVHQDPSDSDGGFSAGLHSPDKATVTGQFGERSLQSSRSSHQGFFADLMGPNIQQAEKRGEDMSQGPSSYSGGTTLEQATSETGIMEEPELTFQTTFDTNVTLESVQELQQDEITSNPSDSLLSFIRHEEQFAHSTPLKVPTHPSPQKVQPSRSLNQGPKEPSEPLTLQDALARHKSSFIKASQARQKEVKVHAGTKSQAGTAFALTIKNWQKAKLEAQQKNRTKGMKKQTDRNKENVETRSKVTPKLKTSQDRKAELKADKERTKRLYNQLEEVRQRKIQSERQKSYAENRQKRKEYEEKMKQRRLQLKEQLKKT